jgi:hypothetical protein
VRKKSANPLRGRKNSVRNRVQSAINPSYDNIGSSITLDTP